MITAETKLSLPRTPLENFNLFQDQSLDTLEASSTDWFTPCRLLSAHRVRAHSRASAYATALGPIRLVYAQSTGTELVVEYKQQEPNFLIMFAVDGTSSIHVGHETAICAGQQATVISPGMIPQIQLSEQYAQLHLRIDRTALERHLEKMLGMAVIRPIRFNMSMDLRKPAVASWIQTIQLLVQDLGTSSGLSTAAADLHPWSDFLMTGLLLSQPHNYSAMFSRPPEHNYRPPALKRALELIDKDPSSSTSIDQMSALVGVSSRTLQREFREYLGVTPSEYVQWVRLCRTHDDLTSGNGETVTEIAHRWGFTHVSRFSAAYRNRYGQLPSDALQTSKRDTTPLHDLKINFPQGLR